MSEAEAREPLVLIVDDDSAGRRLLDIMLKRAGYRTLQAENGERGLEIAAEMLPDLVILDDMLPGILGDEVRKRLKSDEKTRSIKILMHTGRMDKVGEYHAAKDVDAVLVKPAVHNEIMEAVRACLNK